MRLRYSSILAPLLAVFCVAALSAQAPPADQGAVIKTSARDVVVDVVVTKGNGEPVPGLHKQDFNVIEEGKPQTIDFFEEHTTKTVPPSALTPMPPMPPDVYTNVPPAPPSDSVNVLLLDSLNTARQDQSYVHNQIVQFLKTMQPGTRVAIFTLSSKLRFIQGFTTDTGALLAALNDKKEGFAPVKDTASRSREDDQSDAAQVNTRMAMLSGHSDAGVEALQQSQSDFGAFELGDRMSMTFEALDYLARYLGGVPGRKNLIWFSSSFPVTIFPTYAQKQDLASLRGYYSQVRKTADLLTLSKVAVYPIGAEGMMNDHWFEAGGEGTGAGPGAGPGRASSGGATLSGLAGYGGENDSRALKIIGMEQLASDTGGKAYFNTNDLNGAMRRAIDDGSQYYTLVYSPTNKKMDGKYRRIEIKIEGGSYKLAYRSGYNADDAPGVEAKMDVDPLALLLKHGLPSATQLLYGVRILPATPQPPANATRAGQNDKFKGPFTRYNVDFFIRWNDVALQPTTQGAHSGKIQVGLMAYDREGNAVNWEGGTQAMNLTPDIYASIQKSGIPAHMEIDLPSSGGYLVTGVYDWATNKAGTVEIPVLPANTTAAAVSPATNSN